MFLVSVIIPSYNCESYISETIDSVLSQSYPDIEILVVDDGSVDGTRDIVRGYGDKVKLICKENAGVCAARNLGIREASGQYICLMDHDDYWYPDKISEQVKVLNSRPEIGVVYSNFSLWMPEQNGAFPNPSKLTTIPIGEDIDQSFSGWIYHLLLLDCWVLTSTAMFRKEVFERCGVFDENLPYSEDWDLWIRVSRCYPFLKLRKATTLYRQHPLQGNRKVRPIDYRTKLLIEAKNKWGLSSPDGAHLSKLQFYRKLADYHAGFGLQHIQCGSYILATKSLVKAWCTFPFKIKYLAYIFAGFLGWKPNY